MGGALDGVVVADFSRVLAGPLATMFLADLGATVIKVERPGTGDDTRTWGPPYVGELSTYYLSVNRNKRSVTLDLSDPEDLELAHRLSARADVMIQNFLPGRLTPFALDYDSVHARNVGLVYCSITGFGAGPGAALPGYDFLAQAVGGLMSVTGTAGGEPTKVGVALVDVLTGLHAGVGILAALRERDRSGTGQHVEVALLSSLLSSLVNQGTGFINGGPIPQAMGNQHPSVAPYETLHTADVPIAVAVGNDRQFAVFATALGRPELPADPRFATNAARVRNRAAMVALLEDALAAAPAATWAERLSAAGIAAGPVRDIAGALELAAELDLAPIVSFPSADPPLHTLANPIGLSRTPVRYDRPPPGLGADSEQVRAWLGGSGSLPD